MPPFAIADSILSMDEIEWEVRRLHHYRLGGSYNMQSEHLKSWLAVATREERTETAS